MERVVLLRGQDHVGHVGHVVSEEDAAFPARNLAAGDEDRQAGQRHGEHDPDVESQKRRRHHQAHAARHQPGQAQAAQDVEGAAADDVADSDIAFTFDRGRDARGHLGHAGACRDDGQADHQIAHAHGLSKIDRGLHQVVRADHQRGQSGGDQADLHRPGGGPRAPACAGCTASANSSLAAWVSRRDCTTRNTV